MSKFENWIESHSNKEFVEFHRILDIEKSDKYDKKIGFYISYVLREFVCDEKTIFMEV